MFGDYETVYHQQKPNLDLAGVRVNFICCGGLTLWPRKRLHSQHSYRRKTPFTPSVRRYIPAVVACRPKLIILHLGENDLGYVSADEIADDILTLVDDLERRCCCRIYVTQLIRWPCLSADTVRDVVIINHDVKRSLPLLAV